MPDDISGAQCMRSPPCNRLLRRLRRLEDRTLMKSDIPDYRLDPDWLRLPYSRRTQAVKRMKAVQAYLDLPEPRTVGDAKMAAKTAGVSLRSFYNFLSAFKSETRRNIWTFVPYAARSIPVKSNLNPDVEAALHSLIRAALGEGKRSRREVLGSVVAEWPSNALKIPADQTIRDHIESAGGLEILDRGDFRLNTGPQPQETAERASEHGEVLVLDHSGLHLFLDSFNEPKRATLTLAIDLFTATIAGFSIRAGPPAAASILAALNDAERRTSGNGGKLVSPRLTFAATNGKQWRELARDVGKRGLQATIRWGTRLHSGGPTKRLIGTRIADLPISPRSPTDKGRKSEGFEVQSHALVTLDEAEIILVSAIARMNSERLPAGIQLNRLKVTG